MSECEGASAMGKRAVVGRREGARARGDCEVASAMDKREGASAVGRRAGAMAVD